MMIFNLKQKSVVIPLILLLSATLLLPHTNLNAEQPATKQARKRGRKVSSEKPVFKIRISEETTFFAEPLRKDGSVDYIAALNQLNKPVGLTPEKNGAVYLVKAIGLREDQNQAYSIALWEAIGLRKQATGLLAYPQEKDPKLVGVWDYIQLQVKRLEGEEKRKRQTFLEENLHRPDDGVWKKEDHVDRWDWLQANKASLELLAKGTKQPFFHLPLAQTPEENESPMLIAVMLPEIQNARSFVRLLHTRALNHLGENRPAEAAKDLMVAHKFARQIGKKGTLIGCLVGIAIESIAFDGDRLLFQHPEFSSGQLKQYAKTLQALPQVTNMKDSINTFERCMSLDIIQHLPNCNSEELEWFDIPISLQKKISYLGIDWNQSLTEFNEYYNELEVINQKPYLQQKILFEQYAEKFSEVQKRSFTPTGIAKLFLLGKKQRTTTFTNIMKALLIPALQSVTWAQQQAITKKELALVHVSLELYKRDQARYPEKLEQLVPRYLAKIPRDRFIENENIKYKSDGKSFKLYSVGNDGKDNNGASPGEVANQWDIVIAVP